MTATAHIASIAAAAIALATAAPAQAGSYGWPVKPFHEQHPVRGYLGDPRIAGESHTTHFGIDISAPNGTAVYATLDGVARLHPLHPQDVVIVYGADGVTFEYWHVVPCIRTGQRVVAYRTVIGHIEKPWAHVHFTEEHGRTIVNPLRPGALSPYRDTTKPSIGLITFERNGAPLGDRVSGTVDVVAEAWDTTPLPVPAPWANKPVAPAFVEWRLVGARGLQSASAWHAAVDFREQLPQSPFSSIYARWTRQNRPGTLTGRNGRYRYYLAHGLDTRTLPNGTYRVVVQVRDTAGNARTASRTFLVDNDV
jgi:hypothetical protein